MKVYKANCHFSIPPAKIVQEVEVESMDDTYVYLWAGNMLHSHLRNRVKYRYCLTLQEAEEFVLTYYSRVFKKQSQIAENTRQRINSIKEYFTNGRTIPKYVFTTSSQE